MKDIGEKKLIAIGTIFGFSNFTTLNCFLFKMLKTKIWANFHRIIELFTQTIVSTLSKIWVWYPGSEIRVPEKPIPDPGSRGRKGTGSRIPIRNTAVQRLRCIVFYQYLIWRGAQVHSYDFKKLNEFAESAWVCRDPGNADSIKETRRRLLAQVRWISVIQNPERLEYCPDCNLAQISLRRGAGEHGLSNNAQLQATVNYSCLCSLHFVMLITQCQAMSELCE
jgi:hypothetical protein